jgi:hypothetical protein
MKERFVKGHPVVSLSGEDGKNLSRSVARLVLSAWDRPPRSGEVVSFKDGDRRNTAPENLAWHERAAPAGQ